jgi:hypothetical protein
MKQKAALKMAFRQEPYGKMYLKTGFVLIAAQPRKILS